MFAEDVWSDYLIDLDERSDGCLYSRKGVLSAFVFHDFWAQIVIVALYEQVWQVFRETGPSWPKEAMRKILQAPIVL